MCGSRRVRPRPSTSDAVLMRKIVHIDMDCFYAAVEVRDNPALEGKPVAVSWTGPRSVVLTANYEARKFGVHSAMATRTALRHCPDLTLVAPRMDVYRSVSKDIREVLFRYTNLVEPLSLDEAYLDVTQPKLGPPSGTRIAERIKREIKDKTNLTASAGVSYNKFLAKLASGMHKPDGLTVVLPDQAPALLESLPIGAFHGIGPATSRRLHAMNVHTGADLKTKTLEQLTEAFGKLGAHYYKVVRGIDERLVEPDRAYKSMSAETTFEMDIQDVEGLVNALPALAEQATRRLRDSGLMARAVVIKLKYQDFRTLTRRRTLPYPIEDAADLRREAEKLLRAVRLERAVRLLGVGVEGLSLKAEAGAAQTRLFPEQP